MTQGKTLIIVLVALVLGFTGGFALRPVIAPLERTTIVADRPSAPRAAGSRSTQYFAAHLDEALQIVAQCADGSVRGEECANAERTIIEVEGQERFKQFMGN